MKFDLDYIEKLVNLVSEKGLTELTLEDGERAIILKKEKEVISAQTFTSLPPQGISSSTQVCSPITAKAETPEVKKGRPVVSPMVGTFYRSSSPSSEPFVSLGKTISAGQVVCIIEAMKLMNEIEAEVSGKIVEICIEDGQPVEYGQVLMYVD